MSDFNIEFEENDQQITLEFKSGVGGAVSSVNGMTGDVVLDAEDVGALPTSTPIPTVDNTLTTAGAAADAKKTGDEIATLKDGLTAVESDVTDLKEDYTTILDSAYVTDTASGAIASFLDGADNVLVKSLKVNIEPVQDLHGQANPYPAGGGVNKLPPITAKQATGNGVTFKSNGDGTYSITGTASAGTTLDLTFGTPVSLSAGTYYVSFFNTAASGTIGFYAIGTSRNNLWDTTLGQANRTFTNTNIGNDSITALRCYVASGVNANVTLSPVVAVNSYSATFAPYENICPISGHTQAVVTRTGKNLLPDSEYTTNATGATSHIVNATGKIPKGTIITASGDAEGTALDYSTCQIQWRIGSTMVAAVSPNASKTFADDVAYDNLLYYTTGTLAGKNVKLQVELGSTATAYEPYNGQTVTIDLDGTIYGGTLDVGTGVLTVDRAIVDLGTLTYTYDSASKRFGTQSNAIPIKPISGATVLSNMICSQYKTVTGQNQYDDVTLDASISQGSGSSTIIRIRDTAYTDATAFKTAMNGVQLCYELATPQTVQLTAEEVTTLKGQNNIWSDAGDVEVEYRADTKLYIEKLTAPTEDDMIADHVISSGSFFMVGNTLYRATTAIASGATITVGTNATKLSLSDALNALA